MRFTLIVLMTLDGNVLIVSEIWHADGRRRWFSRFPVALAGREAFELRVVGVAPCALAGRDAFESLVVGVVPPAHCPDEWRLSRWWFLLLFPVALAGREAFEWDSGVNTSRHMPWVAIDRCAAFAYAGLVAALGW